MSAWNQKRFWNVVSIAPEGDGFAVELDGRRIRTPGKAALILPTRRMAEAVTEEWHAQEEKIDPATMPVTRTANAAIDKVRHQHGEVADMLAEYGDSDLLCYRAEAPQALVERQAAQWGEALDWAADSLGVRLQVRTGLIHKSQDRDDLRQLADRVHGLDDFQLAAFHDLVSLSGSLILGFGAAMNWKGADEIWRISRLDELWQEEQWGVDDDASALAETKRQAFLDAKRHFDLSCKR